MTATTGRLLVLSLFAAGLAIFFLAGGMALLDFNTLRDNREALEVWRDDHYFEALAITAAVYVAVTALSIPGGSSVLSLAVGLLFGRWFGTLINTVAATAGAAVVFLAVRYLFHDAAHRRIEGHPRALALLQGFERNATRYLLFLRLVPLMPFWLVNLVPAFTSMRFYSYIAVTAVGIIPASFIYANLGQSLAAVDSPADFASGEMVAALALLGAFTTIPLAVRWLRSVRERRGGRPRDG